MVQTSGHLRRGGGHMCQETPVQWVTRDEASLERGGENPGKSWIKMKPAYYKAGEALEGCGAEALLRTQGHIQRIRRQESSDDVPSFASVPFPEEPGGRVGRVVLVRPLRRRGRDVGVTR